MVLKDWVPDVMEPTLLGRGSNSDDKQGNTQNAFHLVWCCGEIKQDKEGETSVRR